MSKKTYEICYALFRVTARLKRESFASRLEKLGLDLLESASCGRCKETLSVIESLDRLIGFGADIGFLHQSNAEAVRRELGVLNSAIAEMLDSEGAEEVNISDIFSSEVFPAQARPKNTAIEEVGKKTEGFGEAGGGEDKMIPPKNDADTNWNGIGEKNGNGHSVVKTAMRQSAILDRIRQNGNCRLKELQEVLPDVSERTVRYDLQRLLEQGMVMRIGNGGPATYYKVAG